MPQDKDGRVFKSKAQMRFLRRNEPEVAERWSKEEKKAGVKDHSKLPEKLRTDRRVNPRTGKEQLVAATPTRRSTGNRSTRRVGQSRSRRTTSTTARRTGTRAPRGRDTTREELRERARGSGIPGWYRMNKTELERALARRR